MSVDRRIREGLEQLASVVDADPVPALRAVQRRARRQVRVIRSVQALAVAAVTVLAVSVAPALVDRFRPPVEPSTVQPAGGLVGTYVVDVADAVASRGAGVVGRWVVTFRPDGVVDLTPPPGFIGVRSGPSYRIEGDRVRTDALVNSPGCQADGQFVGIYRWVQEGSTVRFVTVSDTCPARIVLFTGQAWEVAT